MKQVFFLTYFFLFIATFHGKGQELNVEQTLDYINQKLNDSNNKFTYWEKDFPIKYDMEHWDDYKYEVKIEHGNLIFNKTYYKNYFINGKTETRILIVQEFSSSLQDLTDYITMKCNYKKYFSYLYIMSNSSNHWESKSFIIKTTNYSFSGNQVNKTTEKPPAVFFTIEFSNKNLICEKLSNAFNHLLDLAIKDPKYNTSEVVADNDPFSKPINKDTINSNTFNIPKSNSIPMTKNGGVYEIPVLINGVLKLDFIFDAGAADVSISPDVALTLIRTGTVTDKDFLGSETYKFADGSIAKSKVFLIKEIQLGNKKVNNVRATISKSINAPLLLGQSVLNKFGKVTIDYNKGVIVFQD